MNESSPCNAVKKACMSVANKNIVSEDHLARENAT